MQLSSHEMEIDNWEHQLDMMGPMASTESLQAMLKSAPKGAPSAGILANLLKDRVH